MAAKLEEEASCPTYSDTKVQLHQTTKRAIFTNVSRKEGCPKRGRHLGLYCDDYQQAACAKCFHNDTRNGTGKCDFVGEVFDKHTKEINDHLALVQQQIGNILDALDNLNTQEREIVQHGDSVKNQIDVLVGEIIEAVVQSGRQLKDNVDNLTRKKLRNISKQKEYGDVLFTQLKSCQIYAQDRIRNGSQQEIELEKKDMIQRLRAACQELELQKLQIKEKTDIVFQRNHDILERCGKIGGVSTDVSVDTKPALAIIGQYRIIDIDVSNVTWKDSFLSKVMCNLIRYEDNLLLQCKIQHIVGDKYCIPFVPTYPGLYRIEVQVHGVSHQCDPSAVRVIPPPTVKCLPIGGLAAPRAIAITSDDLILVADGASSTVAVVSREGRLVNSFQHQGGGCPTDICVTPDDHILVLSSHAPHITKYSVDYTLVHTIQSEEGSGPHNYRNPQGIAVSTSGEVYVADTDNNRIKVLNPDLTLSHMLAPSPLGLNRFKRPQGMALAVSSRGTKYVYVCDSHNKTIQKLLRNESVIKFKGKSCPRYIAIDCNILYVTDEHGVNFYDGTYGTCLGRFGYPNCNGIAVDEQGVIYVCDTNKGILVFNMYI